MATIKEIKIDDRITVRDDEIVLNTVWYVKVGEECKCVQFSINELGKPYYWRDILYVPVDYTNEQIEETVKEFAKNISDDDILDYRRFLQQIEDWGD